MTEGKKIVDISPILESFISHDDGIESFTGAIGEGKTYGAVRRIYNDLLAGNVVYSNIWIDVKQWNGDERKSLRNILRGIFMFKKVFLSFDLAKNFHYFDMDDEDTWKIGNTTYASVVDFIEHISFAKVYLDEGQDVFDSYEGTNISKRKRKTLTRTRHFHRTIVIISQRYMAIPPTARANVRVFYKHMKVMSYPFLRFKVYATSEIDDAHVPVFDTEGKAFDKYWGRKKIMQAYDTFQLSKNISRSQTTYFEAFHFSFFQRIKLLFGIIPKPRLKARRRGDSKSLGVKSESVDTTIKINKGKSIKDLLPVVRNSQEVAQQAGSTQLVNGGFPAQLPF